MSKIFDVVYEASGMCTQTIRSSVFADTEEEAIEIILNRDFKSINEEEVLDEEFDEFNVTKFHSIKVDDNQE